MSDDGRVWKISLRSGLRFHDGEPVRAADCVASLIRWSKRDTYGQTLGAAVDTWLAADDRTIEIRLKRPFPVLPRALGHYTASAAFMMPERLAKTDPLKPITEAIGSGPFKFLPDEYVSGSHVAYARFDGYVPRDEPPQGTSGGKRAYFERIEWRIIPDAATVGAALQSGEIDWWQVPHPDLLPLLARDRNISVKISDPVGNLSVMRMNCLIPPFNNAALRRVIASAISQDDYMQAIVGGDGTNWQRCYALFPCGLPGITEPGEELMSGPKDFKRLAEAARVAGYNGETIVILQPTDTPSASAACDVTADLLHKLEMKVDLQAMDFGTLLARRLKKGSVAEGGWNIFHTYAPAATIADPGLNFIIRGNGAAGFPGWYENHAIEDLAQKWTATPDPTAQQQIIASMQSLAFDGPGTIPLGQFRPRTAFRSDLQGVLPGTNVVFWNVRRG